MRLARTAIWGGTAALVVLGSRAVAYALEPSPLATSLAHRAGGPSLPAIALVTGVLALSLSSAVVWLAALGVRERWQLDRHRTAEPPRLRIARVAWRASALWLASCLGFALLESYLHWRAGLGWHGLHCLTGPVHRDAVPILGGLSAVAAALASAVEHVLLWIRRTLEALRRDRVRQFPRVTIVDPASRLFLVATWTGEGPGARAPPLLAS